jgi:hypothetical protein
MYKAIKDGDEGVKSCPKINKKVKGYKLLNEYFVDNSGWGTDREPALTFNQFLNKVKAGLYYGITSIGQFQVYIGEYKKTEV